MRNIKILDCTLRDGGYINNWDFGYNNILKIINFLNDSHMDIIEVGFIDDSAEYDLDKTLFNNTKQINNILSKSSKIKSELVAMIMFGKCDIKNIQNKKYSKLDGIRVCFKKKQIDEALEYCKLIDEKGYDVYLQPASITDYSDQDILDLVNKANKLNIKAFYIVDTYGLMRNEDVIRYYYLINNNLKENVPIGFHSHNNLQLSFSNSQALLNINSKRNLYIDSSVFGMGRGAGNLCSELITQHINSISKEKYNLLPILELVDECINPIFKEKPWGYSVAYYIASINKCHPNYSTYLVNKQTIGVKDINYLMKQIPEEKKRNYDENIIFNLYTTYLSNKYDDKLSKQKLIKDINSKNILLIAPGQSISREKTKIDAYIKKYNPYIISINFIPESIETDAVFFSNIKRFNTANFDKNKKVLFTSNINLNKKNTNYYEFNYSSYLNDIDLVSDNAALMLMNILKDINVDKISIAGFDGYELNRDKNYYDINLKPDMDNKTLIKMNNNISKYLSTSDLKINFLTSTNYRK